jgi:outer membrane protein assembly factor BamA
VFAYRGKFGYQEPLGKTGKLPLYSRFYLGGGSSLRGWYYNDFIADGGNVKVLTNIEIRFPLFWILGGEVFIDGGNLASDIPSLLNKTYRWDAGFGLTIATPLGPIRIDIAKVLGEEKPYQWQFSIPYAF